MRNTRRLLGFGKVLVAVAGALLVAGSWASPAGAVEPDKYAWWNKAQQLPGGSNAVPAPPSVPSDGIYLANDPSGPAAIAALRFTVAEGGEGTLVLNVATGSSAGGASLLACPTTSVWDEFLNGQWTSRPSYDCTSVFSSGVVTATGDQVTFDIRPNMQLSPGAVDVAIVPQGPLPFQVAFQKPDASALTGEGLEPTSSTGEATASEPASEPGAEAEASPSGGFDSGSSSAFAPLQPGSLASATGAGTGQAGGGRAGPAPVAAPRQLLERSDGRGDRLMAVGLLMVMGLTLWWMGGSQGRAPRLLGSIGGRTAVGEFSAGGLQTVYRVGGIGRFARARSVAPRRL